jgi:hypothetical protein
MQKGSRNPELYENGVLKSQKRANKKYDKENVDNVRLRVPKGWNEQMQEYVKASEKYSSVNAMICDLIRKEVNPS